MKNNLLQYKFYLRFICTREFLGGLEQHVSIPAENVVAGTLLRQGRFRLDIREL